MQSSRLPFLLILPLLMGYALSAQVVFTDPFFPTENDDISIFFNADEGNTALEGFNGTVYAHTGVITSASTSGSDWRHVVGDWGTDDARVRMTRVGSNRFKLDINIRNFYNVPMGEEVLRLAFVFRNQDGSTVGRASDGSDIFYEIYPDNSQLQTRFLKPTSDPIIPLGGNFDVFAAASATSDLKILDDGMSVASTTGNALETTIFANSAGVHLVEFIATNGNEADTSRITYKVPDPIGAQDPPAGTQLGINYTSDNSITLRLHAPNKANVFVIGDFNNWTVDDGFQMIPSLDGEDYWITIDGLTAGEQYTFQYLVDGQIKIADPYSTLVLDPNNDRFITASVYPNLPTYPANQSGIVTVVEPGKAPYNWQTTNYDRPDKTELVVYELLMRDFLTSHRYADLLDTLNYLETLGINAIELMPVNEFEGNDSWGYNPSFHMALDKYYGDAETFKAFIDEAHARGIAVILDVVYNHVFSQSPLAQLYWDAGEFRPTAENPWLNVTARHPFNVGYDVDHESQASQDWLDRVVLFWLEEYQIDGFRFDLSKGFTQRNSGDDVGAWGNYDASRIALLNRMANVIWAQDAEAYVILEHFANNTEEKELADAGMMLWNNINHEYNEASMGYDSRLSAVFHGSRGWSNPHLVSYMESHDEERLMYKNLEFGASAGNYSVKDLPTALNRQELVSAFFYTIPGPKMLWEFGELGYELSINRCTNGTVNDNCRLDPKPILWDYLEDANRLRLYNVTRSLIAFREFYTGFDQVAPQLDLNDSGSNNGQIKSIRFNNGSESAVIVGNFNVVAMTTVDQLFPETGLWYDYLTGDSLMVNSLDMSLDLAPGEYHVYTNTRLPEPPGGFVDVVTSTSNTPAQLAGLSMEVKPNPVTTEFVVSVNSGISGTAQLQLVDVLGRQVGRTQTLAVQAGRQQLTWPTTNLESGIYWLQVQLGNALMIEKILVK